MASPTVSKDPLAPEQQKRVRKIRRLIMAVLFVSVVAVTVSVGGYVSRSQESLSATLATWARDHRLGVVVDELEQLRYGSPPSAGPASELGTVETGSSVSTQLPTATTTTTVPLPPALEPRVTPALAKEGVWEVARVVSGRPAIWVSGIRPLKSSPSVTATYALVDQDLTYAAMWNGPEIPAQRGFSRYKAVSPDLHPYLLAAFNGGFRKEHTQGGYLTEGREIWKMDPRAATLGIDTEGRIHIGLLGDGVELSEMVSVRQNVRLLVKDSKSVVGGKLYGYGSSHDRNLYIVRSAVCEREDGKLLFAIVGPVDAEQLAVALVRAGCSMAMQLDVNAAWPKFSIYDPATPEPHTRWIDKRITGPSNMFLRSAPKDFFALFDRTALPEELVEKLK